MNGNNEMLIVANWKMGFSHDESLTFVTQNYNGFCYLAKHNKRSIVLCPQFTALFPLHVVLKESAIKLGAQDCSNHARGAFTSQISAQSLKSLNCSYCIVGHSERRKYNGETDLAVAQKTLLLLDHGITPIICIGECSTEFEQGKTLETIENQLKPIHQALAGRCSSSKYSPICIAYEPTWSIGTGKVPSRKHLEVVYSWLHTYTQKTCPGMLWKFLYGGSVTQQSIPEIRKVPYVGGFLVGGASLDFQEFKKIVECIE